MSVAALRGLVLALAVGGGALLGGCSSLPTGCPAALLEGTLFSDPNGNLLVKQDVSGEIWPVQWPDGYSVREVNGRVVVTDLFGGIKAGDGDRVGIGGGTDASDEVWVACGNMDSLVR